jgi:hypothetical protein
MSPAAGIERDGDGFVIDAALVAEILGIGVAEVREGMRSGAITTRCETGEGADAGRWRLTFHHGGVARRLVVDDGGRVLRRSAFPAPGRAAASPPVGGTGRRSG